VGRTGEHEKLFDESYSAAIRAVCETLRPALAAIAPGTETLVVIDEFEPG